MGLSPVDATFRILGAVYAWKAKYTKTSMTRNARVIRLKNARDLRSMAQCARRDEL